MLNVGIPELPPHDESTEFLDSNPEEINAEPAVETGDNANLESDTDPAEAQPAAEEASLPAEPVEEQTAAEEPVPPAADLEPSVAEALSADTPAVDPLPIPEASPEPHPAASAAEQVTEHAAAQPPSVVPQHEPAESFGDMLHEFERTHSHKTGEAGGGQTDATVVSVSADSVFLDIGFKTEGVLPLTVFATAKEPPKPGDKLRVTVKGRNEEGYYDLSLLKVAQPKDWTSLEAAFADKSIVAGTVTAAIKGGLSVDVGMRAFMPASRSGARDASEMEKLVGQEIRCRIIKLDVADEDIVVDRRAVLEEEERGNKERRYSEVTEGDTVSGTVRSLTSYGAFVDIGGVDALLHISDIAWSRIANAADVLTIGQQIEAKVLKVEPDKKRISIGLKQLQPHPWDGVAGRFTTGERVPGVVTRLTDFGAFIELAPGIEGLVHISEMSWAKKVRKPGDMVKIGDSVEVVILSINQQERRISLGLKQALGDPWTAAAERLVPGAIVEGPIVSFTKFGAFMQVAEGVEGMVHISEIAADKRVNHPQDELKIGQVVKALVLEADKEKRQLKLSIKQLIPSSLDEFIAEHAAGDTVSGRIIEADGGRLVVELGEGIRVPCKLPAVAVAAPPAFPAESAPASGKPDLSALSSMLKARWKSGPSVDVPLQKKSDGVRTGQVLRFRITSLDAAAKRVEIEAI